MRELEALSILRNVSDAQIKLSEAREYIIEKSTKFSENKNVNFVERWINIKGWDGYIINTHSDIKQVTMIDGEKFIEKVEVFLFKRGKREEFAVSLKRRGRHCIKWVKDLVLSSFDLQCPYVNEIKIIDDTIKHVRKENTIMRIEQIDKNKPFSLHNAKYNYICRGERHWNHKLTNEDLELIRSNPDLTIKQIIEMYGNFGVSYSALYNAITGKTWRVRVNPITQMTYNGENFPDGKLINYLL